MNCKHCGETVTGNFCSHCGQNKKVSPITFKSLLNELSANVFQVNKGFFYTLKEMFIRPGDSIRDYLSGKRKNHFKPIGYVLILSTVYFLVTKVTGQNTWINDIIEGVLGSSAASEKVSTPEFLKWFADNYAYTTLLLLPIFSLASYISFSTRKLNYIEHIVTNSYVAGQQAIFYSLFSICNYFLDLYYLELIPLIASMVFLFWVFNQIFSEFSIIKNIGRIFLTYFLNLLFSFFLFMSALGLFTDF